MDKKNSCPDCQKEMEAGFYILRNRGADGYVDTIWKKELTDWEVDIIQQFDGPSFNTKLKAFRCKSCLIVQFKYSDAGRFL